MELGYKIENGIVTIDEERGRVNRIEKLAEMRV